MKALSILITSLAMVSTPVFAAGIAACESDELTMDQINAIRPSERVDLTDKSGNMVGALEFTGADKKELQALYLCGPNNGYYYAEGETASWIGETGTAYPIGSIYSDEYDVEATAKTLSQNQSTARVNITVNVKFTGEPEYADWEPFEASFYAVLPK